MSLVFGVPKQGTPVEIRIAIHEVKPVKNVGGKTIFKFHVKPSQEQITLMRNPRLLKLNMPFTVFVGGDPSYVSVCLGGATIIMLLTQELKVIL